MTAIHTYGLTGPAKAEYLRLHRIAVLAAFADDPSSDELADILVQLDDAADAPIPQTPLVVPPGGALHDRLSALEQQIVVLSGTLELKVIGDDVGHRLRILRRFSSQDRSPDMSKANRDEAQHAAVRILEFLAAAFGVGMILSGIAIVANAFTPPSAEMSENTAQVIIGLSSGAMAVLGAAVGAALYPARDKLLPAGVGRALQWLGGGVALFFVLLTIGVLISGARIEQGITDNQAQVVLVIGTGILSILSYAGGNKAMEIASQKQQKGEAVNEQELTDPETGIPDEALDDMRERVDPGLTDVPEPDFGGNDIDAFGDDGSLGVDESDVDVSTDESVAAVPLEEG